MASFAAYSGGITTPHVAVVAFPGGSHPSAILLITRCLAASSPTTIFSFFCTDHFNMKLFSSVNANNIRRHDVWDGVPQGYDIDRSNVEVGIELFMRAAPKSLREAVRDAEKKTGRRVTCVLSDAILWLAVEMAEELAVPWVAFWNAGERALSALMYTDLIRETIGVEGAQDRKDELLTFIPGMSTTRVQDLPEGIILGNLESYFSKAIRQMGQVLSRAALVLTNSFEGLDPIVAHDLNSKLKNLLRVGPFNLVIKPKLAEDPSSCLKWLDNQKPSTVAYIAIGNVVSPNQEEIVALAEALEESSVKFLWSLRDQNLMALLPNGFEEKNRPYGMVVPWAPQVEVLNHKAIGVFINHCGWNSLCESITTEVPMIIRPFAYDQMTNAILAEDLKIGVRVEGGVFTKQAVKKSLEAVLHEEEGRKMKKNVGSLKQLAEKAIGPNGSSTKNFESLLEFVTKY